jgi:c-di-GMP-binding flagellar brake protein YcgR
MGTMISMGSPIPDTEPTVGDGSTLQTPEEHVWHVLVSLNAQRSTVLLRDRAGSVHGTSLVLGIDKLQHQFLLDAHEQTSNEFPLGEPLWLEARVEGRRIELTCQILDRRELPDGPAWVANGPELLLDEQRRTVYRLRISDEHPAQARLVHEDAPRPVPAQIIDLSRSGVGVQLGRMAAVDRGTHITCMLRIVDLQLEVESIVRYRHFDKAGTRLGMEFCDMSAAQEAALNRAVFRLERQLLRERRQRKE